MRAGKGDDNVVARGKYGESIGSKEDIIYVKRADDVRIRVMRSSMTGLTSKEAPSDKAKSKEAPSDKAKSKEAPSDKAKDKSSD